MAMATFPLLNLPPSISDQILERLDFGELFDLSQCSKRTFNVLKTFGSKRETDFMVYIETNPRITMGTLEFQDIYWLFLHNRHPKIMDLENPQTYKIPGCGPIDFCVTREPPRTIEYGCVSPHSIQDVLKCTEYILTLFNGSVNFLSILNKDMKYLDDILSFDTLRRCGEVSISHGHVTHEELRKVLERFTAEEFSLSCTTTNNFFLNRTVKCNSFCVFGGKWVNLQTLLKLECAIVEVSSSTLTNEDLKHWLEGSDNKLEYMSLTGALFSERTLDLSKIVEGVPNTPGVPKRQDATNYDSSRFISYENGVDLRRADGIRATALVSLLDNLGTQHFLFVVWHVPNPDLVVVE